MTCTCKVGISWASWAGAGGEGKPPDNAAIWIKAVVQIATALAVTFINMATQWKFQAIDHFSHWVKDMKVFLFYLLIIVTIGGSRYSLCAVMS